MKKEDVQTQALWRKGGNNPGASLCITVVTTVFRTRGGNGERHGLYSAPRWHAEEDLTEKRRKHSSGPWMEVGCGAPSRLRTGFIFSQVFSFSGRQAEAKRPSCSFKADQVATLQCSGSGSNGARICTFRKGKRSNKHILKNWAGGRPLQKQLMAPKLSVAT